MELERIRQGRNATPFRPFTLVLDDGREFLVEEPYYVGFSPKGDLVLAVSRQSTAWFSPERIKEIRFHDPVKKAG